MHKCTSETHSFDKGRTKKSNEFPTLSVGPPKKPVEVPRTLEYQTLGKLLQVWQNIPVYLSERIESVHKKAFKIIYPDSSYNQALILANETMLSQRHKFLCNKLMAYMNKNSDHPLNHYSWCPLLNTFKC